MDKLTARTGLPIRLLAALLTVYIVWGSTYFAIKIGVEDIPPMLMGAVRFLLAGAVLYVATMRGAGGRPTARQWLAASVGGLLMLVAGNGAVTWAEQQIDSGVAALLIASVPLWMALIARVWQGERLRRAVVAGLLVGFVGVGVLVRPTGDAVALIPSLAVLAGALAWAIGSIYIRRAPLPDHALRATSMQMLTAAAGFTVLSGVTGEFSRVEVADIGWPAIWAVLYLVVFGSLLAFSAYTWLLRNAAPSVVSTYAYVNPFVAVLLGAVWLGEAITGPMVAAAALIIVGVALIVTPPVNGRARALARRTARSGQVVTVPATAQPCEATAD